MMWTALVIIAVLATVFILTRRSEPCLLAIAFVAGACGGGGDRRGDTTVPTSTPPSTAAISRDFSVTEYGIGPVRAGMTVAQVRAALGTFEVGGGVDSAGCTYATSRRLPAGVRVMVERGIVARIDVDTSAVLTAEGARVGDSEERVRALYGNRLTVGPHKYTAGHYLTVRAVGDTMYRIVFETNAGRVTTYRAGRVPQVQYVERCG